ncbi:MAG: lipopolysaccharide heptosyltransferase I [Campylobacteraceae bacterium]|nr:lipopolysaccharide heptosyltransferase I [Campylobacteraceae bacterium]
MENNIMDYKNILIIKMSSLGDILHTLPFAAALRERFPKARISWLVHPQFADFIPLPSVIDEVIFFDKVRFQKSSFADKVRYFFHMRRLLREKRFDLVIDMQGLFKSAVLAFLSGCKNRIGYCEMRELSGFVSKAVCGENRNAHVIERYLDVARFLGSEVKNIKFPMADLSLEEKAVEQKLKSLGVEGRYIVVVPAARWWTKEWPLEHYAKLVSLISKDGFCVVLAGGAAERAKSQKIVSLAGAKDIVDLSGDTTLRELAALIKAAAFYISADTGPLHFAAAFKKPLIAMYGPTLANRTGPYANDNATVILSSAPCTGCLKKKCDNWHCMADITPEAVYKVFKDKIGKI